MVKKLEWLQERKKAAELLEELNRQACIHFAEQIRNQETVNRLSREIGKEPEQVIPLDYFDACYRILSFGKLKDRILILLGKADDFDPMIQEALNRKGFYDENDRWHEL